VCSAFDEGHEWIESMILTRICSEKVSDESKITPRLRAEFVSVIVTLEGIKK